MVGAPAAVLSLPDRLDSVPVTLKPPPCAHHHRNTSSASVLISCRLTLHGVCQPYSSGFGSQAGMGERGWGVELTGKCPPGDGNLTGPYGGSQHPCFLLSPVSPCVRAKGHPHFFKYVTWIWPDINTFPSFFPLSSLCPSFLPIFFPFLSSFFLFPSLPSVSLQHLVRWCVSGNYGIFPTSLKLVQVADK